MKRLIRKLERTIVFMLKTCLYAALFLSFFGILGIDNPQLLRPSRTAAITILTFIVAGLGMTAAYGRYDMRRTIQNLNLRVLVCF